MRHEERKEGITLVSRTDFHRLIGIPPARSVSLLTDSISSRLRHFSTGSVCLHCGGNRETAKWLIDASSADNAPHLEGLESSQTGSIHGDFQPSNRSPGIVVLAPPRVLRARELS